MHFSLLPAIRHLHDLLCDMLCLPSPCYQILCVLCLFVISFVETQGISVCLGIYHLSRKKLRVNIDKNKTFSVHILL